MDGGGAAVGGARDFEERYGEAARGLVALNPTAYKLQRALRA